ncbi:MAG: prepilin-type N-terminal cleavage/methylation domain-containing protein [bacterium]|nr:prepilin-type N-terminal cleavage/methylation domain-containing protein [bacterium]
MRKNDSGFTLVESMIAVGLIVTGVVGVLTLVSRSIGFSGLAFNRLTAANLAQEGIEIVRSIRDTNWINGLAWDNGLADGDYQLDYSSKPPLPAYDPAQTLLLDDSGYFNYATGKATVYQRKITIKHMGADQIQVKATISWTGRGGGNFETIVEDRLFNWH